MIAVSLFSLRISCGSEGKPCQAFAWWPGLALSQLHVVGVFTLHEFTLGVPSLVQSDHATAKTNGGSCNGS